MPENSNTFNNKVEKIIIDEMHDIVTYFIEDGRIISSILSDIINRKKEIFKNFKISPKCHELTTSFIKRRKLEKVLNPIIIEGLNDNIDIMDYIRCVKNQTRLPFILEHNTIGSSLKLLDRLKMKNIAKYEKKLGANVNIIDEKLFNLIKNKIVGKPDKYRKEIKENKSQKEKENISILSEKNIDRKSEEIKKFLKNYYDNTTGKLENIRDLESVEHNLKIVINWYIDNQKSDKADANMRLFSKILETEGKYYYEPNIMKQLKAQNRESVIRYVEQFSIKNYELQKLRIRNLLSLGKIKEAEKAYKKTLEVLGINLTSKEMMKSLNDGIKYGWYYIQDGRGYKRIKIMGNESVLKTVESLEETSKKYEKNLLERNVGTEDNPLQEEKDNKPNKKQKIYSKEDITTIMQKCDKLGNTIKFQKGAIIPVIDALISYLKVNHDEKVQNYLIYLLENIEQINPIDLLKEKTGKENKYNILIFDYISNLYKNGVSKSNGENIIEGNERRYSYYTYLLNRRIEDFFGNNKFLSDERIKEIQEEYSKKSEDIELNYFEELLERKKGKVTGLKNKLIKVEKYSQAIQELENNSKNDSIRLLALSEDLQSGIYRRRVGLPTNLKTYTELRESTLRRIALNQITNSKLLQLIADIENEGIYDQMDNEIVKCDKKTALKIYNRLPRENNAVEQNNEAKPSEDKKKITKSKKKNYKDLLRKIQHINYEEKIEKENDNENNIYVCSDLHGQYELYRLILSQIKDGEKLYILGDVIDRGPDGIKILRNILQNKDKIELFVGNHELMMIQSLFINDGIEKQNWIRDSNGGRKTQEDFLKLSPEEQENIKNLLMQSTVHSEITIQGEKIYLVHAKADKTTERKKETVLDYLNENREKELYDSVWARIGDIKDKEDSEVWQEKDIAKDNIFTIIGHTPTDNNKIDVHSTYAVIDCGAANYGNGCLLRLNDGKRIYFDNVTRCLEQLKNEEER